MKANVTIELVACILLLVFSAVFYYLEDPNNEKNKKYGQVAILVTLCSISNLLHTLGIQYFENLPVIVSYFLMVFYYSMLMFIPISLINFLLAVLYGNDKEKKKKVNCLLYLYLVLIGIVITSPITKLLFYYEDGMYQKGILYYLGYVYLLIILFFISFIWFNKKELLSKKILHVLHAVFFAYMAIVAIKILYPNILVSGFSSFLILLVVYMCSQNAFVNYDSTTGLLRKESFNEIIEKKLGKGEAFDLIIISLEEHNKDQDGLDYNHQVISYEFIIKFLKKLEEHSKIIRYSEQEFVLLLMRKKNMYSLEEIVEKIQERFRKSWVMSHSDVAYRSYIGVVKCPEDADQLKKVNSLLEYSVNQARLESSGVFICNEDTYGKANRKKIIYDYLYEELMRGGEAFQVVYQPIYSVSKQRFDSAEALLRIPETSIGRIGPNEFIPIAEETGLIIHIGKLVIQNVCKTIKLMQNSNCNITGISINFSVLQMLHKDIVTELETIIKEYEIDASKIRIEITESVFINQYEQVRAVMLQLDKLGIQFYLDDFGVGYSNIANVMELPFDCIKFDKSLIWGSEHNDKCYSIVSGLSETFSKNGISTLAEGVENTNQDMLVKNFKVDFIQGFYYAKPSNTEEIIKYFHEDQKEFEEQ